MESISISQFKRLVASGNCPSIKVKRKTPEEDLHMACLQWALLEQRSHPNLRWLVHVPNGGKRPKGEAGKLKAMGTKPGYPDLTLPRPCRLWRGLAIELKSPDGRVSPEQIDWLNAFLEDGWLVAVCRSLDEFIAVVRLYLTNTPMSSASRSFGKHDTRPRRKSEEPQGHRTTKGRKQPPDGNTRTRLRRATIEKITKLSVMDPTDVLARSVVPDILAAA